MTDYEIRNIYLRGRDRDEEEIKGDRPPGVPMSYQELYVKRWMMQGMSMKEIRSKWERDYPNMKWNDTTPIRKPEHVGEPDGEE